MSISGILLFFVILLVLVLIHELGHFIAAKLTGMRVDEFAFGFPPRIISFKKGETEYSFNALPLGGYVAIFGENGEKDDKAKGHPRAFGNRPWWAQVITLLAGVTMNMFLAWVIFVGISYGTVKVSLDDEVYGKRAEQAELIVLDASPESPAFKAGLVPGVVITKMSAGRSSFVGINASSATDFIRANINNPITVSYISLTGEQATSTIAAVYGILPDRKAIGVSLESVGYVKTTVADAFSIGTNRTIEMTQLTFDGLVTLVQSIGKGDNVIDSLSGPIGIAKIVGQTSEYGYAAVLTLVAVLSINLAIFNILPFPALDGGRIIIVFGEVLTRRKFPLKYMSVINAAGFIFLILLLILVSIKDVTH